MASSFELRDSMPQDLEVLFGLWERAVRATHSFLAAEDVEKIAVLVRDKYLPNASMVVAIDRREHGEEEAPADARLVSNGNEAAGIPIAFMGLTGCQIDSLFVEPARHRCGAGRALVAEAQRRHGPILTADVNEANSQALSFYRRLGFQVIARSAVDGMGMPYPLLHLARSVQRNDESSEKHTSDEDAPDDDDDDDDG